VEGRRGRPGQDPQAPPRRVGDVVDRWLAAEGLTELKSLAAIRGRWSELAGEDVALHSSPRAIHDGVLVVEVDHSGWGTELRFREGRILELLKSQLGAGVVRRLDARVTPGTT
jgi:predicted nucleic acid-binding Zn ribbon protein